LCSYIAAAESYHESDVVGEYLEPNTSKRWPIQRFQPLDIHIDVTGAIEAMPHWAGELVDGITQVRPAAEIVRELADEAEQLLRQ
jgi:hypothetical protein